MTEFDSSGSHLFATVARDLAEQPDLNATIQRIVDMTVQLSGARTAALWAPDKAGRPRLRAASGFEQGTVLDDILTKVNEGPAHTAISSRLPVLVSDLATDGRWPIYVAAVRARGLGFRSIVVYPLHLGTNDLGALGIYSDRPDYFVDEIVDVTGILAEHATIVLQGAESAHKAANLGYALDTNRRIGTAIGILMIVRQLTEDEAFDVLRSVSQSSNRKLRDIADEIVETGWIPQIA
jgi:transcriptional regulator with GAF, ATPase, and Fis domain